MIRPLHASVHIPFLLALSCGLAYGQSATSPSTLQAYATIHSIGIEWLIVGDANHNASATVSYRPQGSSTWAEALPLVRIDSASANMLAGSILFLAPGTTYDVVLTLADPDGGADTRTLAVSTRALPARPAGGRTLHVVPGTGGGAGSAQNPYRGIAAAQAAAAPGDVVLLHQGNYGGRILLDKAGTPGNYLVWMGAGDGEVLLQGIDIAASDIWLEGVTIRNQTYGIRSVNAPANVVIRRNNLSGNHHSIFLWQDGEGWYIADNTIVGDTPYGSGSLEGEGIDLSVSSGHTIAHNSITNVADGVSSPNGNVDIFGNDIFDTSDDGIEADNGWANLRMWGNRIHNAAHYAISFQPQVGGPWYIVRNQIVGNVEGAFKFRTTDRFVMLHNTIVNWGNAWPGDAMICCNEDHLLRGIVRNNLWIAVQGGQIWGFDAGIIDWRTDIDYNGFDWGAHQDPFVYGGVSYPDVASLAAGTGLEQHGVQVARQSCFETFNVPGPPPIPVPPQALTLQAGCAAVDAGALLPNVNGSFTGAAPDLGAFEHGHAVPVFGPRALAPAQIMVSPSSIRPGGSATLSWTTSGATDVAISPSVGSVGASGSTSVSPAATTTYTLTAEGPGGTTVSMVTLTVIGDGTPFNGTPAVVPGTIEAERFNDGGAGIAYHDLTAGNSGGAFRNTDVDIQATTDTGGGYNVGWTRGAEWLNYTINVTTAGTYTLEVRVASNGTGGTFHLNVNGADNTGPLVVPNTGGSQTWTLVTKSGIALAAGTQVLRLVMDANGPSGGIGNFNWLRLTLVAPPTNDGTPFNGTPAVVPGTIEAERFNDGGEGIAYHDLTAGNSGGAFRNTDVDIQATTDTGGGYNVGWTRGGEWLNYTINVTTAGTYTLEVRVASNGGGGTFHLNVNGVDRTGPLGVPNTGGWQIWTLVTKSGITLAAGTQVLRLVMDANGPSGGVGNLNWLRLTPVAPPATDGTPFNGTPAVVPGTIEAERFNDGGEGIAYHDLTAGNSGGAFRNTDVDIQGTTDTDGGYNAGWTRAGEWLNYTINVTTAGTYTLEVRVASNGGGGTFHLNVNGVDSTGPLVVPNTGGWQTWTLVTKSGIPLAAGTQVLRLVMDANGPSGGVGNLNWLRLR
jgi:Carbohydrate binding module (family 6)/Right handed beta helix region